MSTAIIIYFGKWIKSIIPINLIMLLLLVHAVYIGIRCYVKNWRRKNEDIFKVKWAGKTLFSQTNNTYFQLSQLFRCLV